ncbi:MAG: FAD-dependent oxidoreductase [Pseudomonadota bacterium]
MVRGNSAVIVGAGVVGMATAYALARRGFAVTVVDGNPEPAMGASHANGAQLSYCYTDALANPATLKSLPALLLRRDPAFRLHCRPDWRYLTWLCRFLANCTSGKFERHTLAGLNLAKKSFEAMDDLMASHNIDFGLRTNGKMHLLDDQQSVERANYTISLKKGLCGKQEIISRDEAIAIEPALEDRDSEIAGAIYSPAEQVGDPFLFCREMAAVLTRSHDVKARFKHRVAGISPEQSETRIALENGEILTADLAIVCAATSSNQLLAPLGIKLPVEPMKGYSFEMPVGNGSPVTSITDTRRRLVFTNLGDRMRVAGLADLGDRTPVIRENRMNTLMELARQSLPHGGRYDQASGFWTGLRPMTPNSLPIISHPMPGLAINTGHGMLGWTMAMGSGERLAELVCPD